MPFKLPKKCRTYFEPLTGKDKNKLEYLFDGYYLSVLVGMVQAKIDSKPDLEASEFVDEYPAGYKESGDFIVALLIATEVKRISVNISNADELEKLMTSMVDSHSKTRLSSEGMNRLNQYASRGINAILDIMMTHTNLAEFYQEYFECFENGKFIAE